MNGKHFAAALLSLAVSSTASASLIFEGVVDLQGTGVGNVLTILTLQETGKGDDVEYGGIAPDGDGSFKFVGTDVKTGTSQTGTPSLADLGVTSTSEIRLIFNANEPSGNSITIDNLILSLFSGSAEIFDSGLFTAMTFNNTRQGVGQAGFVFRLDDAQALAATTAIAGLSFSSVLLGVEAQFSGAQGGFETIFGAAGTGTSIPEPPSLALLGLGLLGTAAFGGKRRKQSDPS